MFLPTLVVALLALDGDACSSVDIVAFCATVFRVLQSVLVTEVLDRLLHRQLHRSNFTALIQQGCQPEVRSLPLASYLGGGRLYKVPVQQPQQLQQQEQAGK